MTENSAFLKRKTSPQMAEEVHVI